MGLFRTGWWPGPAPTIAKDRVMCSDCKYHRSAMAGWQWDRCEHPDADMGGIVRNNETPKCCDMRNSSSQCGISARWFAKRTA